MEQPEASTRRRPVERSTRRRPQLFINGWPAEPTVQHMGSSRERMQQQSNVTGHDAVTDPAGIATEELTRRYRRLRAAYVEAQARTTTTEQLHRWQQRSARLQRMRDDVNLGDLHQLLDANSVLYVEQQLVAEFIDTQIASRLH